MHHGVLTWNWASCSSRRIRLFFFSFSLCLTFFPAAAYDLRKSHNETVPLIASQIVWTPPPCNGSSSGNCTSGWYALTYISSRKAVKSTDRAGGSLIKHSVENLFQRWVPIYRWGILYRRCFYPSKVSRLRVPSQFNPIIINGLSLQVQRYTSVLPSFPLRLRTSAFLGLPISPFRRRKQFSIPPTGVGVPVGYRRMHSSFCRLLTPAKA